MARDALLCPGRVLVKRSPYFSARRFSRIDAPWQQRADCVAKISTKHPSALKIPAEDQDNSLRNREGRASAAAMLEMPQGKAVNSGLFLFLSARPSHMLRLFYSASRRRVIQFVFDIIPLS